jgi:hypothetical protein
MALVTDVMASFPTCPIPEVARLGRTLKQMEVGDPGVLRHQRRPQGQRLPQLHQLPAQMPTRRRRPPPLPGETNQPCQNAKGHQTAVPPPGFDGALHVDPGLSEAQHLCFKNAVVRRVEYRGGSVRVLGSSPVKARGPVVDECVKNIHHNRATGPWRLRTRARLHPEPRNRDILSGTSAAKLCFRQHLRTFTDQSSNARSRRFLV